MGRLLFLLMLISGPCLAQKKDTVSRYLDNELQLTTEAKASFYGVSFKLEDHWYLYAIYPDTTPVLKANYKDKQLQVKDGYYCIYYPKRKKAVEGIYMNNRRTGVWRSWYENGNPKDSGALLNNLIVKEWKTWHQNGQLYMQTTYKQDLGSGLANQLDLTLPMGIKHGPQKTWYQTGILESEGTFENDKMEGEWRWYHENGKLSTIERYYEGKLSEMKCMDSTGKETGDFCSISKPALLKEYGDYKTFIRAHLLWPDEAVKKKIEGVVKVKFMVDKNGELKNLQLAGDSPILKKAVEDLFLQMKDWYPAVSHNRAVDWEEETEIPFYFSKR